MSLPLNGPDRYRHLGQDEQGFPLDLNEKVTALANAEKRGKEQGWDQGYAAAQNDDASETFTVNPHRAGWTEP